MSLFNKLKESVANLAGRSLYLDEIRNRDHEIGNMQESLSRLQIELDNIGYQRLTYGSDQEFSRQNLKTIMDLGVVLAIKNPIVARTVNVSADYVFGRGVNFVAVHPLIQQVVDEHVNYGKNQADLYSHDSMCRQEREFKVKGNLFFCLVTNPRTGRVIVRSIDFSEVGDVIRNPRDYREPWLIQRTYSNDNGSTITVYHPALGITDKTPGVEVPAGATPGEIMWDEPVLHVQFNRYGRMKFSIPELYPMYDWAFNLKQYYENWLSIMKAYARMAMQITGLPGKKQAAAAKAQLQSTASLSNPLEGNPSAVAASTGLFGKGVKTEPVKTAGATTGAEAGQPILNMAAAGGGLPNSFYGDASMAKGDTLDRPTELKMVARQKLWATIFTVILNYAVYASAKAPNGILGIAGALLAAKVDPFDDATIYTVEMPKNEDEAYGPVGEPITTCIEVKFPELLERNVTDRVRGLVNGLTQFGKPLSDIVPDKRLASLWIMRALGIENPEKLIPGFVKMWTKNMTVGDDFKPVDPTILPPLPPQTSKGAEDPSQGGDVGNNG